MTYTDLSGIWEVFPDKEKRDGIPEKFSAAITLPNTTSNAGLGGISAEKAMGTLTDLYKFEGFAWFRRTIDITPLQAAERLTLVLERTRRTAVFVDGRKYGEFCSLCTPHLYDLSGLSEGEHELAVCVDNTDYPTRGGHLTSPDTQTNWNGITGEIALIGYRAMPQNLRVISCISERTVTVCADICGEHTGSAEICISDSHKEYGCRTADISAGNKLSCTIKLAADTPLWSEFSPALLNLTVKIGEDVTAVKFGSREFSAKDGHFEINGQRTFLLGKHDGLVFPETGFAPTDPASWERVFRTAMEYGINHYRFHTCCPPEAAFEAADMLGIYLQPELPFRGLSPTRTVRNTPF